MVAVVSPCGEEESLGVVFVSVGGGVGYVGAGDMEASGEGVPVAGSGGDVVAVLEAGFGECLAVLVEGCVGFVSPDDGGDVLGELVDEFGAFEEDLGPELGFGVLAVGAVEELFEEVEVDGVFAVFLDLFVAAALSELPGFVAADVELFGGEVGEEFLVELVNEVEALWAGM